MVNHKIFCKFGPRELDFLGINIPSDYLQCGYSETLFTKWAVTEAAAADCNNNSVHVLCIGYSGVHWLRLQWFPEQHVSRDCIIQWYVSESATRWVCCTLSNFDSKHNILKIISAYNFSIFLHCSSICTTVSSTFCVSGFENNESNTINTWVGTIDQFPLKLLC